MGMHIFPGRGPCHQVPLPEAPYKVDVFLAAAFEWHTGVRSLTVPSSSSKTTSTDYWAVVQAYFVRRFSTVTRFPGVRLLALAVLRKYPLASSEVEGRWQWPSLDLPFFLRHSLCVRADLAALDR